MSKYRGAGGFSSFKKRGTSIKAAKHKRFKALRNKLKNTEGKIKTFKEKSRKAKKGFFPKEKKLKKQETEEGKCPKFKKEEDLKPEHLQGWMEELSIMMI